MRDSQNIESALEKHGTTVWHVCAVHLPFHDAQDAYQETFVRYAMADQTDFKGEEHEKAWLIRVATNVCKDMLKASSRKVVSLDQSSESLAESRDSAFPLSRTQEVLDAIQEIPEPSRTPLYLSVYEGYTAREIADMLGSPLGTVDSWIARGKKKLREALS